MHIGERIREVLTLRGMSAQKFAEAIPCTREHAYKIFRKENLDILLLLKICRILNHDFFKELSDCI